MQNKTKPAAKPKGAVSKAAPKKATVKKTVVKKQPEIIPEKVTPQKEDVPVVPLQEHEKVKSDLVSAKLETSKEKERAAKAREVSEEAKETAHKQRIEIESLKDEIARLKSVPEKAVNTYNDVEGYIKRGNEWVYAAVTTIILGVWLFFVYQHNGNLQDTIDQKNARITELENRQRVIKPDAYDSLHEVNNRIPTPEKQNFSGAKR